MFLCIVYISTVTFSNTMNSNSPWDNFLNKVGKVVNKNKKKVSKRSHKRLSDDIIRPTDMMNLKKKMKILLQQNTLRQ